jgi:hypothetical protein
LFVQLKMEPSVVNMHFSGLKNAESPSWRRGPARGLERGWILRGEKK